MLDGPTTSTLLLKSIKPNGKKKAYKAIEVIHGIGTST
jgi:hypothetical protein